MLYGSVEEATGDMAKRGLPVLVIKHPESLLEQIQRFTWRMSRRPGNQERAGNVGGYKERLLAFRCLVSIHFKQGNPGNQSPAGRTDCIKNCTLQEHCIG